MRQFTDGVALAFITVYPVGLALDPANEWVYYIGLVSALLYFVIRLKKK